MFSAWLRGVKLGCSGRGRFGWRRIVRGFHAAEGHPEELEELSAFFVVVRGRYDRDVESHGLFDILNRDFRKNGEIGNAERIVTLAVQLWRYSTKVANRRQRHCEQTIEKFPHRVTAKSH